ncbi:tyrosine-type recombinase/integrase [Streptomyces sp. NPDC029216]|uniref:tyrosine-type recombinase/integrase n=1 Tax=Streptomyces sp. NPDC029216 TaxID=3154701 RepID=UPI0033DB4715
MGTDPAQVRRRPCPENATKRPSPDGPGPAGDRRWHLGQAALGGPEHRVRRPADRGRPHLSRRADPGHHADLALRRPTQRRDRPPPGGLHPLAVRRPAHPGDSGEVLARDAVCLLDVPTHKTGTAFTKPVDPLLGQAIEAWQAVRPAQPPMLDRKTNECADFLFAHRARRVAKHYINTAIIPMLCRKAGVPDADVRGNITSHRGRSTIASQLYNAKEPMTLFELQEWLGHRTPEATTHYAKLTPNTLARAYNDVGYFARNVRTIEVLADRDAVTSGAAASGEPWQYYDLGHGWCTYTFFEQCQHRTACARCDFYTPKESSKGQLLLPVIDLTTRTRSCRPGEPCWGHLEHYPGVGQHEKMPESPS